MVFRSTSGASERGEFELESIQEPPHRSATVALRIKELEQAHALEYPRYNDPPVRSMLIGKFLELYKNVILDTTADVNVQLRGRIMSIRLLSNKLAFITILERFETVEIICNLAKLANGHVVEKQSSDITGQPEGEKGKPDKDEFRRLFRLLKRGDSISVVGRAKGKPAKTQLEATQLPVLLSPSLRPLPHQLQDDETRIQQRHVDLLVHQPSLDILRVRSEIMSILRRYLQGNDFLEVDTPILAGNAGGATARPFSTTSTEFPTKELALRVAPELWLKRLIMGGIDRVFEIGPAFRNEGLDLTHNPEFATCEFYLTYASLQHLTRQTEEMIQALAVGLEASRKERGWTSVPKINPEVYHGPFPQVQFIPALESALKFSLPDLTSATALDDLNSRLRDHNIDTGPGPPPSLPKLLDRLAEMYIEPQSRSRPIFIIHHPECMSPLAKSFICPETQQVVSARAELFIQGREIANMYEEENDPFAQRRKFAEQAQRRARNPNGDDDGATVVDESYIAAIESGMPPTAGWGCGVERLTMLFSGAKRISDCLSFGSLRNVVALAAVGKK